MNPSDIIYGLGEEDKDPWMGAVSPPIYQTTNFAFNTVDGYRKAILNEKDLSIYTRGNNPTIRLLERKLAALQGTEDAIVFGSGSAAIAASVMSQLKQGDHVICVEKCYSWTFKLLDVTLKRFGVTTTFVDGKSLSAFKSAVRPETTLVVLESPNSLFFELQDLEQTITWAKSEGFTVIVDNSYGSILNQKPVAFGADLVCHSATKFIGGHSDVVAGVACGNNKIIREVFYGEFMTLGASISPHAAWLLIRGLRTLPIRLKATADSGIAVTRFLHDHPAIEAVYNPFHSSHPQHDLALKQFDYPIPMFSFKLATEDRAAIERFCNQLKVIQIAASWGGYESLIVPLIAFDNPELPANICRLYIGLEDSNVIIKDLRDALIALS